MARAAANAYLARMVHADHTHDAGHSEIGHNHGLWTHDHRFLGHGHERAESRAKLAAGVTAVFMVVEITAGFLFGSMALLADGVHMATHVGALGLAAGAYWLARRHADNSRFTFGSGKFGDLAAFSSAIVLGLIALGVAIESVERLLHPVGVNFREALMIAALGFFINVICALILRAICWPMTIIMATIIRTVTKITTCALPMCMSSRMLRHRCLPFSRSRVACSMACAGSIPPSASSAPS